MTKLNHDYCVCMLTLDVLNNIKVSAKKPYNYELRWAGVWRVK